MNGAYFSLQKQIRGLLDSRHEMCVQMHSMVPRSDLEGVKAEAAMLLGTIEGLQREVLVGQQERERLVSTMQVRLTSLVPCPDMLYTSRARERQLTQSSSIVCARPCRLALRTYDSQRLRR
jgi:hypothetical protein